MFWRFFAPYGLLIFFTVGILGLLLMPAGTWREVWGVALLTAIISWLPAVGIARRFVQPLRELNVGAQRVAAGGFGQKVYLVGRGEVGELARAFNDLSERLAGQITQLEADREQLRTILEGMVEGVLAIDSAQNVRFANDRAAALLEFNAAAAVGRKLWEVVRRRQVLELVAAALRAGAPARAELDWRERHLAVYVAPLPGRPAAGAVLVLHDTTDLRRLERVRQEFVANVSHELKTPLCVIKVCVETLIDGAVDDVAHRGTFLHQIADQSDRLQALILDLISLARIESGEEVLTLEDVPLGVLVHDCLDRHRARAEAQGQQLHVEPGPTGLSAWADAEAARTILDNLVDNAVKYTPAGGTITVRWRAADDRAILEVADTGPGIPERDLPRLFERFYRVDKARSRELGGTGLGLAIVKHLAQLMKGSARAASELGNGSTFTVELPQTAE